jgi:hypothetical protein
MVAGRSRYHAARFLLFVQAGDHGIGPAQFEAVHWLTIFSFHQNGIANSFEDSLVMVCSGVT